MCGDLEEDQQSGAEQLYAAFLHAAQALIHEVVDHRGATRSHLEPGKALGDPDLHRYMDGLFADILRAVMADGRKVSEGDAYRLLSAQAVVMAKLAGFLAGRLDPGQDPLRSSIEALMSGYSEPDSDHHHEHHH